MNGPKRMQAGFTVIELVVTITVGAVLMVLVAAGAVEVRDRAERARCASNLRQLHVANTLYAAEHGHYVAAAADSMGANLTRWHGVRSSGSAPFDGAQGPLAPFLGGDGAVRRCGAFHAHDEAHNGFEQSAGGYGYNAQGVGSRVYLESGRSAFERGMKPGAIRKPARTVMFADAAFPQPYGNPDHLIEYSFAEAYYFVRIGPDGERNEFGPSIPSIHFRHAGHANVVWADGHVSSEPMGTAHSETFSNMNIGWLGGRDNDLFSPF